MPRRDKKRTPNPGRRPSDDDQDDDEDDEDDDDDAGGGDKPMSRGETIRMINSAVSAQLTRRMPKAIEEGTAPIMAQLAELGGKLDGIGGSKTKGKGKGKRRRDEDDEDDEDDDRAGGRVDPNVEKLTKQVETLTGKLKEQSDAAAKAERARRDSTVIGTLREGLGKIKVDSNRMKGALAVVRDSLARDKDGNFELDDEGSPIWRVKRDGYDEDLSVEDGLAEWAGTDEGKSYIAAGGAPGGSGARPRAATGKGTRPGVAAGEAKAQRQQQAKGDLLAGVQAMLGDGAGIPLENG